MSIPITLQFREQLPDAVREEFDQIIAALQQNLLSGQVPLLTADPVNVLDDTVWVSRVGQSPAMIVALKARVKGVTRTIASITV